MKIILVDDGSSDQSGSICDEYAKYDTRIKVIHKKNGRVSVARNDGIDAATNDFICFLYGDDYVEYILELALINDADISLITQMFGNFDEMQVDGDKVCICTGGGEDVVETILCYRIPIGCYCKLFRTDLLSQTRFVPDVFIGE